MQKSKIENILRKIQDEDLEFHETLFQARERLGMKLSRAAELIGCHLERLKRLESGMFRNFPRKNEMKGIADLYGFDEKMMSRKCTSYLNKFKRPRRLDENSMHEMPSAQKCKNGILCIERKSVGVVSGVSQDLQQEVAQGACREVQEN